MAADLEVFGRLLNNAGVHYIVIGGWAAILHGSVRTTRDVDVVYSRDRENLARLVAALKPIHPYLRGAPPGLPFAFDEKTVRSGLNFTLTTDLGDLDLLGEVTGGGTYDKLIPFTEDVSAFGMHFCCVTLERLIQLKRAAGRPKDFEPIAELQVLLEEQRRRSK